MRSDEIRRRNRDDDLQRICTMVCSNTPERQQTLEVLPPSVGHAFIRLQIGLKAHARPHGDVSHSSKQRRRTGILGAYL